MHACEYEESGADDLRTCAVVSIQYASHWSRENTDEVISKASSRFTGALVDVFFVVEDVWQEAWVVDERS